MKFDFKNGKTYFESLTSPSFDELHCSTIVHMNHMEHMFQDLLFYGTKKVPKNHIQFFHSLPGACSDLHLKKIAWEEDTQVRRQQHTDIATTRPTRPRGPSCSGAVAVVQGTQGLLSRSENKLLLTIPTHKSRETPQLQYRAEYNVEELHSSDKVGSG